MLILSASISSYIAAVAFYHSKEKRALASIKQRIGVEHLSKLKVLGCLLLAASLLACLLALGTSRGVSVWLGLVTISGLVSLVWVTLRPSSHLQSVLIVTSLLVLVNFLRTSL